jgi:trimethylamine:corrinoid methyltransferase-like protein
MREEKADSTAAGPKEFRRARLNNRVQPGKARRLSSPRAKLPAIGPGGGRWTWRGRPRRRGRERGGRARCHRAAERAHAVIAGIERKIPTYELIGEEGLSRIEAAADTILQDVGIDFRGDEVALRLWREAGADVQGERVRFPQGLLRSILKTAPNAFVQHARNPERSLAVGAEHVVFAPAYGWPFVRDLEGGRRYGTLADFENFVKLAYAIPWLHHSGGTVCEPVDVPVSKRHLGMVAAHLTLSDKPFMSAGAIAQSLAETMAGCALAQLERPGAPVVFGNLLSSTALRSGSPTFGTPEPALGSLVVGQLARRLNLPLRCSGAFTSSKIADGQAMQESTMSCSAERISSCIRPDGSSAG